MLNFEKIYRQINEFSAYHVKQLADRATRLERALAVFEDAGGADETRLSDLSRRHAERLVADPLESLTRVYDAPRRPAEVTVVATDGSQIYPDRHVEPVCYLLNVSRIAFHYGVREAPLLETAPQLYFRGQDVEVLEDDEVEVASREIVSALRDALELTELLETARSARVEGRPILAIADGTMIRWMLRGMRNRVIEKKLLAQYIEVLEGFRVHTFPLCSYISMPASREVVNLVSSWGREAMDEPEGFLDGVSDRMLFDRLLKAGQRSAAFKSRSLVLKEYPAEHQICSFYVKVAASPERMEIARVEFPHWMMDTPGFIDLVHAVVCEEAEKGRGYPMILSEAHEHAVVRGAERTIFYEMIEREMMREGLAPEASMKRASKERPMI